MAIFIILVLAMLEAWRSWRRFFIIRFDAHSFRKGSRTILCHGTPGWRKFYIANMAAHSTLSAHVEGNIAKKDQSVKQWCHFCSWRHTHLRLLWPDNELVTIHNDEELLAYSLSMAEGIMTSLSKIGLICQQKPNSCVLNNMRSEFNFTSSWRRRAISSSLPESNDNVAWNHFISAPSLSSCPSSTLKKSC